MISITQIEYELMKGYIEKNCGIFLEKGKEYLIETRLSDLVIESGCSSFSEFYQKINSGADSQLRDRIVDAMTTNETLWFRDESAWNLLKEQTVPALLDKAEKGIPVRIWSAAASTGQEAYSLLMVIDQQAKARGRPNLVNSFSIVGTDISSSALFLAIAGRYDAFAMKRGMPDDIKNKYFKQQGNVWVFDQELKKRVKFQRFNLQDNVSSLGKFDLVLVRYVMIYFSDDFKKILYRKIAGNMNSGSTLLLGATESLRGLTDSFNVSSYKNAVYNVLK